MTTDVRPVARRYWLADATALAAIRAAEDPPRWGASDLPVTVLCLDDESFEAVGDAAEDDSGLRIVDARDPAAFGATLAGELESDQARYIQFAFRPVDDFAPALDLLLARLDDEAPAALGAQLLAIGRFETGARSEGADADFEDMWIAAEHVRNAIAADRPHDRASLRSALAKPIRDAGARRLPLIVGAHYLTPAEQPEPQGAERDAALWRARTARAWSEIERLRSEKRVRSGREAALRARHERDLARQAERTRQEIDRLYRAAGWAGRWRARLARFLGRR
ncbi:MAG: hypothetical protein ACTS1X_03865 [Parasphingopyxis sp.]|uniref:hypothetical protein n=1 Tax=Parasphingopyxis sp. TaxID=1920299 RepID=UPI003F9F46F8